MEILESFLKGGNRCIYVYIMCVDFCLHSIFPNYLIYFYVLSASLVWYSCYRFLYFKLGMA